MMDFAPLSPVPGLDTSRAAKTAARPRGCATSRPRSRRAAGHPRRRRRGGHRAEQQDSPAPWCGPAIRAHRRLSWPGRPHRRGPPLPREYPERAPHPARRRAAVHRRPRRGGGLPANPPDAPHQGTDLLDAGVPIPASCSAYGHVSPEMTMHYAKTLAETHEAKFLWIAKLRRDGRPLKIDPADVYELVQLDRHTDRILPNGICCCRRPSAATAERLPDLRSVRHRCPPPGRLRARLAATEELIQARQAQHRQRTGAEMDQVASGSPNAPGTSLAAGDHRRARNRPCGGAVRARSPARPGEPVPVTIGKKPADHGMPAEEDRIPRCARPQPPNATPLLPAPEPDPRLARPASPSRSARSPRPAACR